MHADWYAKAPLVVTAEHDVVRLYGKLRDGSRSQEVLKLLPAESKGGLTPEELGLRMRPEKNGATVSKASARAAIRVIQTVAGRLAQKGVLSSDVLKLDFSNYEIEGAGRYAITDAARRALDKHLKK